MLNSIKSFIKQTFVYGFVSGMKSFVEFLLLPLYARYLLPTQYGQLDMALVFTAIVSIAVVFELTSGVFRFYYDSTSPDYHKRLISTIIIYHTCGALVVSLIMAMFARPIANMLFHNPSYSSLITLSGILLILNCSVSLPFNLLRLQNNSKMYTLVSAIQMVVAVSASIFFVAVMHIGVLGVIIARILSFLPALAVSLWLQRKYLVPQFDKLLLLKVIKFSAPLIPVGAALLMINGISRFFLLKYCSLEEVGLLAVGQKFTVFLTLLVLAFQLAWPQFAFSRMKNEMAGRTFARIFSYFCAASVWMVILIDFFGKAILQIQTAPAYLPAAKLMTPLALGMMFYGIFYIFTTALNITRKTILVLVPIGLGLGINIAINWGFAVKGGAIVVAWATVATYLAMAITTFIIAQKQYYIPFEWRKLGKLAIVGLAIAAISGFIPRLSVGNEFMVKGVLFMGFPSMLGLWRFLEPAELKSFTGKITILRGSEVKIEEKDKEEEKIEADCL
jgi:O-antigen/teichoic acid export membrane protein